MKNKSGQNLSGPKSKPTKTTRKIPSPTIPPIKKAIIVTSRRLICRRKSDLSEEIEPNVKTNTISTSPEKLAATRIARIRRSEPTSSRTNANALFSPNLPFPEADLCANNGQRSQSEHESKVGALLSPEIFTKEEVEDDSISDLAEKTRLDRKRRSASNLIVSSTTDQNLVKPNLFLPSYDLDHSIKTQPNIQLDSIVGKSEPEPETCKQPKILKLELDANVSNGRSDKVVFNPMVASILPANLRVSRTRLLCECMKKGVKFPSSADDVTSKRSCGALEGIESKSPGCCTLPTDDHMYQVSTRKNPSYRLLCSSHLRRLRSHKCCPICGRFCTEGEAVTVCEKNILNGSRKSNVHLFHQSCALQLTTKFSCPHCGETERLVQKSLHGAQESDVFSHNGIRTSSALSILSKSARLEDRVFDVVEQTSLSRLLSEHQAEKLNPDTELNARTIPLTDESFLEAIEKQNVSEVYKHLASSGAGDPNIHFPSRHMRTPVHLAVLTDDIALLHIICDAELTNVNVLDEDDVTPLMLAAQMNSSIAVEYLISVGADQFIQDKSGFTVMHHAVQNNRRDIVQLLLDYDESLINIRDNLGLTPLMLAAKNNLRSIANLISTFLESNRRAVLELDNEFNTSLHWAARLGSLSGFLRLLDNGAYLDVRNSAGETPLHWAMRAGQLSLVACLLDKGADPYIVDREGTNFLDLCNISDSESKNRKDKETKQKRGMLRFFKMKIKTKDYSKHSRKHFSLTDIAKGNENFRISCLNLINEETLPDFIYTTSMIGLHKIPIYPIPLHHCRCSLSSLPVKNIDELVYDQNQRLFEDKDAESKLNLERMVVRECGSQCPCDRRKCKNRVVQNGIKAMLQVFHTPVQNGKTKGWGLRTLTTISMGSFICEYIGEILTSTEMESRADDSYSIELLLDEKNPSGGFFIDTKFKGNLSRFINHSCNANAVLVKVLVPEGGGSHVPRLAIFARSTILSNEEITFDYGKRFWESNKDRENFSCLCGEKECAINPKPGENCIETEINGHD